MKIAITTSSFARYSDEPLKLLDEAGVEYVLNDKGRALTEEEAIEILEGCDGVAAGTEPLTRKVMDAVPTLKVISRCGTGMDSVDRAYAAEKGIQVRNTPDGPTLAVAELVVGLILTLMRHVPHQDRELRSGVWKKRMGNLLHGKNVGIVGFGKIGRAVARLLEPFGVNVGYHDPFVEDAAYTRLDLDELMGWADVITLHCPKTENGQPLLDLGRLSLMRPGSFVLNVARGRRAPCRGCPRLLRQGALRRPAEGHGQRHPDPAHRLLRQGSPDHHGDGHHQERACRPLPRRLDRWPFRSSSSTATASSSNPWTPRPKPSRRWPSPSAPRRATG